MPGCARVARAEALRVDAVGDHPGLDDRGREHGVRDLVQQPTAGRGDVQAALLVQPGLAGEVVGGGVPGDRRVGVQVGAVPTARTPALAVERVRAVTGQQPGVVQGEQRGDGCGQPREQPQVEVAAVQVVQVGDVTDSGALEQAVGRGVVEVLVAQAAPGRPHRLGRRLRQPPRGLARPTGRALARRGAHVQEAARPAAPPLVTAEPVHSGSAGWLVTHPQLRVPPTCQVGPVQLQCHRFGATSDGSGARLQDAHAREGLSAGWSSGRWSNAGSRRGRLLVYGVDQDGRR